MTDEVRYKNITATVRPPRCAVLINQNSQYWREAINGTITKASEIWGGRYFLIIPTDGQEIDSPFWEILEAYSPDYIANYQLTLADLADRNIFTSRRRQLEQEWIEKFSSPEGFDRWFIESTKRSVIDKLSLSDNLKERLRNQLSPFHHRYLNPQHIAENSGFGYPFTKVTEILSATTRHIGQVIFPGDIDDPELALLIHSQTGIGNAQYLADVESEHFSTLRLPDSYDATQLLRDAYGDPSGIRLNYAIPTEYMSAVPFALSMLHLGQYYRADTHDAYSEPVTVILGDTVDDYCLYYSLSRIHDGVYWLPLNWVRIMTKSYNANQKRYARGEPISPSTEIERSARTLIDLFLARMDYGDDNKRIVLTSMSLSQPQLISYRTQIFQQAMTGDENIRTKVACTPAQSIETSCVARVFEQDNYANYRDMAFVNNESVSFFDTPRPKNFSRIKLPGHYWLTSLNIEGFCPPSLPTLGPRIIKGRNSSTESRVAADGISYICPNSIILSADLDSLIRRPKIETPETMDLLDEYFRPAGITAKYSDKGNYFLDSLRRFDGLDGLGSFIKEPQTRSILDKFMSTKDADHGNIIYLSNDQRAYLNLGAIAASIGNEERAANIIDTLVGRDVLQRGYILQCERCRLTSWYDVDSLTTQFDCSRCNLRQQYTLRHWRQPFQPHWYYKLAETIYQFYRHNSHVTAQVLYKLSLEAKTAFHFAPEIDLFDFPGADDKKREMDIACILDGQLIFGECKTETLRQKDTAKFRTLRALPIKDPNRIIFATTKPVTQAFKDHMDTIPGAEVLTCDDLFDT